eukprot:m.147199 g.147199  ORF g.147199 m.147199 type:complete len:338 (+) comp20561_c4_seq3:1090-2103(+)
MAVASTLAREDAANDRFVAAAMFSILGASTLVTAFLVFRTGGAARRGGGLHLAAQLLQLDVLLEVWASLRAGSVVWVLGWLHVLEGVLRSAPGSVLQIYSGLTPRPTLALDSPLIAASLAGSVAALAAGLVAFERAQVWTFRRRKLEAQGSYLTSLSVLRLCEVTARVFALGLFASVFGGAWFALLLAVDYVLVLLARLWSLHFTHVTAAARFSFAQLFVYMPLWMVVFWDWYICRKPENRLMQPVPFMLGRTAEQIAILVLCASQSLPAASEDADAPVRDLRRTVWWLVLGASLLSWLLFPWVWHKARRFHWQTVQPEQKRVQSNEQDPDVSMLSL